MPPGQCQENAQEVRGQSLTCLQLHLQVRLFRSILEIFLGKFERYCLVEFKAKVQFKITLNLIPEKQRKVILFFNAPTLGLISFEGQLEVRIGVRNYLLEFWRFSSLLLWRGSKLNLSSVVLSSEIYWINT